MKNRRFRLFSPFFATFIFLLISIQMFSVQGSQAQWVQTGGPEGGEIRCIISYENKLFASTEAGIFVSTNNGLNWEAKNNGLQRFRTYTLFVLDAIIFAGNEMGVYRSTDGGESWMLSHDDYTFCFTSDGSNLYATMGYDGVYMTTNKGESWINIGLDQTLVNVLVTKGTTLYAGTADAVYITTNQGETWTMSYNGLPSSSYIMALIFKDNTLFASVAREGIYRSTNNGNSWEKTGNSFSDLLYTQTFFIKDNLIYAGTYYGIYASSNNGSHWYYSGSGIENLGVSSIIFYNGALYSATGNGIYSSVDGFNWDIKSTGIKILSINSLEKHGTGIYAGDYRGVYKTEDNGNNWSSVNFPYGTQTLFSNNNYLYALTYVYNGMFRTSNGGLYWNYIFIDDNNLIVNLMAAKDNYLFAGTTEGIYRSSNNGENWNFMEAEFNGFKVNSIIVNNNNLYAGTSRPSESYGQIFRSSDNGESWVPIGDSIYYGVKVFGSKDETIYAGSSRTLYTFNNNGGNWTSTATPEESIIELIISENSLIANTYNGIYVSTNNGIDWTIKNHGLNNSTSPRVYTMLADNDYLYISQEYASIWKRPLRELIGEPVSENPTDYSLKQNYPNPFNPITNIEFSLPIAGNVKLNIYDITGKLVASLLNQEFSTGSYKITWNAANTASGIYFYKLTTKYFTQTKRMMLIK